MVVGEGCEAGGAGLAVCNMGVYESTGWRVASEARCWKSNLRPVGTAWVESRKRCPKGWKPCSSPGSGALPVRNSEPRQVRRGKGSSENRKNLLTPAQDSHYSHWFKTGQVHFGFKAEMAKLPKGCFQPSLEQVRAPTCLFAMSLPP